MLTVTQNMHFQETTTPRKKCVSFLLAGKETVVILLITPIVMRQCPACHFIPKNWISCAGPLTLPFFFFVIVESSFQKDLDYPFAFPRYFLCCVAPHNDIVDVLQMLRVPVLSESIYDKW